jgi:uncharacterized protein (DUF1501 family)
MTAMKRRDFVRTMCAGGLATFALPNVQFARVRQTGRLVFVLLRGGVDGLAAVVPYGDPAYGSLRGAMAFEFTDLVPLDDTFGLAPGLAPLAAFRAAGELVVLHAMAIPYRTRSHFEGQAVLETGLDRPAGSSDGWLNRVLQVMDGERAGIAIAAGMPRSMTGAFEVQTWSPTRLGAALQGRVEAALQQQAFTPILQAAARILRADTGPNVAALEFSGWDTHASQGMAGGNLDRLLGQLAEGLVAFKGEMETAWSNTTVVVMTEFGRTARPNGTRGTDHGTAGVGFMLGPRLARSTVLADWPGLGARALFEGRDLMPTRDTRAVLKAVLAGTFDLTSAQVNRVFPRSDGVRAVAGLMR